MLRIGSFIDAEPNADCVKLFLSIDVRVSI
jgi:hypothetical protein